MTDRPILFSGPMVRALHEDRKTQTRRAIAFPGLENVHDFVPVGTDARGRRVYEMKDRFGRALNRPVGKQFVEYHWWPKYAVGDRLWVREAWRTLHANDILAPRQLADDPSKIIYEADPENRNPLWAFGRLRASMHMPRWASRLTLIVEGVKIEQLQDISEEDALAEGVLADDDYAGSFEKEYCQRCGGSGVHGAFGTGYGVIEVDCAECATPKLRYRNLWDHINGPGSWDDNPWVAAYTFRVIKQNIDHIGGAA